MLLFQLLSIFRNDKIISDFINLKAKEWVLQNRKLYHISLSSVRNEKFWSKKKAKRKSITDYESLKIHK